MSSAFLDQLQFGADYKTPFFTTAEQDLCPKGWFAVDDLNDKEDSIDSKWCTDTSCHPSMTNITVGVALHNVVLAGKIIGRVRNDVYDVVFISQLDDNEYNKRTIQDVRQYLVSNMELVATINKYSSPMSDSASSYGLSSFAADDNTNYCSDDAIEDNVDANNLESESSDSDEQQEGGVEDEKTLAPAEKKGNKVSIDKDFYAWDRHTITHNQ
eukprot:9555927-Ditylum_brightwellii.AAC.1